MTPPPKKDQRLPTWVEIEAEKKRRRKAPPKPKKLEIREPRIHVKVNLSGSVEFELEGDEAAKLTELLRKFKLDDVIEFVDPWASAAELRYDVEVTDLVGADSWEANETTGTIELRTPYRPWPDTWR